MREQERQTDRDKTERQRERVRSENYANGYIFD